MTDQAILEDELQQEVEQEVDPEIEIDLDSELLDEELPEVNEVSEDDAIDEESEDETEEPEQKNNPVRQLRNVNRDLAKKLKLEQQEKLRLQQQLESLNKPIVEELGPEPDLSDEGIDYDPVAFKQKWAEWNAKKQKIESQKAEVSKAQEQAQQKFNKRLQAYESGKQNYKGIDEAEKTVTSTLDLNQQGVIVNYADDPAFVVWALGKNPVALSQLSMIKDPIEYAIKVREIERKAKEKMATKRTPEPEKVVTGKKAIPSNHDKVLDRLRSEGKITEALAYRKKHGLL